MKKILIEISSPAAVLRYDMFVPDTLQIGELAELAGALFVRMSNGTYQSSDHAVICSGNNGSVIDPNLTVKAAGITNGTKLLLF